MGTKIRSSSQLYIDDNLQFNSKKGIGILPGTATGDAVEFDQLNAAINNAVAGAGNAIHEPVQDLAAAKAVPNTDVVVNGITTMGGKTDKMIMLVENLGLYRYDADSTVTSNDGTIIRPTDVATDATAGRWIKMSSILTDHTLLNGLLGNGEYHLSLAERDKLTGIAAGADVTAAGNVGAAIGGTAADATLADTDSVAMVVGSTLGKATYAVIRNFFKTTYDGLYEKLLNKDATGGYVGLTGFSINFKNALGTFTSFLTNANSAAHTYTFPDKDITVAGTSDVATAKAEAIAASPAETGTTIATIINAGAVDATVAGTDVLPIIDSAASTVVKKVTLTGLLTFFQGALGFTPENSANKGATGGYVGMTIFNINFKNVANTFTSLFTNANTAARTYTFPDKDITVAGIIDITNSAETVQTIGTIVAGSTLKATPADGDWIPMSDITATNIIKKFTWANLYGVIFGKVSSDITVTGAGVATIAANAVTTAKIANDAVDNTKLANMTANTVKGSVAGGDPADLSVAQLRTMLGLIVGTNLSQRYYRATPAGLVNSSNAVFTIAALVVSGTEEVFKNGILMNAGGTNDYTIAYAATTTITFVTAPSGAGFADVILVNYSV